MIKLTAQIINDYIVGIDIPIPPQTITKDKPFVPFRIEETISPAFSDISSIINWELYGHRKDLKRDYGFVRDRIKELIKQKGRDTTTATVDDPSVIDKIPGDKYLVGSTPVGEFATHSDAIAIIQSDLSFKYEDQEEVGYKELSPEEKAIAVKYNIGNLDDHEQDFSVEEVKFLNFEYHQESTETRMQRRLWVETLVFRDLPQNKAQVVADMRFSPVKDLISRYTEHGEKGTEEDRTVANTNPNPAICDYLYSRSIFDGNGDYPGLSSKLWQTRTGRPLIELIDEMYDCLVFGIYR